MKYLNMKNLVNLVGLSALFLLASCADTLVDDSTEQSVYYKLSGTYHNDYPLSAQLCDNENILLSGYTSTDLDEQWMFISCLDAYGMVLWDSVYTDADNSKALNTILLSDANYLALCAQENGTDSMDITFLTLSTTGTSLDSSSFTIEASAILCGYVKEESDTSLLAFLQYSIEDPSTLAEEHYIEVYRKYASTAPEQVYTQKINGLFTGKMVSTAVENNQFYLAASVAPEDESSSRLFVLAFENGVRTWNYTYTDTSEVLKVSGLLLYKDTLILAGNCSESADNTPRIYTMEMNLQGQMLALNKHRLDTLPNSYTLNSFDRNASGNFVLAGDLARNDNATDILLMEINPQGKIQQMNSFGSAGENDDVNSAFKVYCSNNYYHLIGRMESANNYDICIFKLNAAMEWLE